MLAKYVSFLVAVVIVAIAPAFLTADEKPSIRPSMLKDLDAAVLPGGESQERMLSEDVRARLREANVRESAAWRKIDSKAAWEAYRDRRIAALRDSLGQFPPVPKTLPVKTVGKLRGKGYVIEKLLFESRPGLWVTANLYQPEEPSHSRPGILICHSHHNPKTQSELQDMGILWARAGCVVLVMDQLGHGERRQHPFASEADYKGSFRASRQDYYFRYNTAAQLHLAGESLIGWMAWDLMRGADLLLSRAGVDPKRILLLGAVAGGGDPVGVTAALDSRMAAAVPFNFGGPQPETGRLSEEAENTFNYAGSGSWESTRNLRLSARDGFLPWVIVGAIAPRGLIYAHEFRWDQPRDPVWKRLKTIYHFYQADDRLSSVHGMGAVTMSSNEATHCNNIGTVHRKGGIHASFEKWFQIPQPDENFRDRRPAAELLCLNNETAALGNLTPLHQLADRLAEERLSKARSELAPLSAPKQRERLRKLWQEKLGDISPYHPQLTERKSEMRGGVQIEKFVITGDRQIRVPVLLLIPPHATDRKLPLTIFVAQAGKDRLLKERAEAIAALLEKGVAVCLPDLRGSGETAPGNGRSRQSWATSLSASELMLGQTMLGSRLKDLRALLSVLRERDQFDSKRFAIWGDSLAAINSEDRNLAVPYGIDERPSQAEPSGPLLALFAGLYEDDLAAVVSARADWSLGSPSWKARFSTCRTMRSFPEALHRGGSERHRRSFGPQAVVDRRAGRWPQSASESGGSRAGLRERKETVPRIRLSEQFADPCRRRGFENRSGSLAARNIRAIRQKFVVGSRAYVRMGRWYSSNQTCEGAAAKVSS